MQSERKKSLHLIPTMSGGRIPVINMEDFPSESKKLLEACEEWGCFRIINHKIPQKLLSDTKIVVRSLLDRPVEIKRRNKDVICGSGYVGPTKLNPLYEGLGLFDIGSTEAVEAFCDQLDASPQERETIKAYSNALQELTIEMGGKVAESMGLGSDLAKDWPIQFRINKYNFTEETVGSNGVCIHTDAGFLTILQEDDSVGGLEVMDKHSGEFIAVDPFPGSLCVNLGDIANVWSNGKFCNVKHRVQCKQAAVRVSIAVFLLGPRDEVVEAPSEFIGDNNPRLYQPFTYLEFRKLRLSTGLRAGEALELVRVKTITS